MRSCAVAPAKVILTGEHFVVYGTPAIVAAVNIYSKAAASKRRDRVIVVQSSSPRSAISWVGNRCKVIQGTRDVCERLRPISRVTRSTLEHLDEGKGVNIRIDSSIPVGVGLGSSAAVAVSTIAAVARLFRRNIRREMVRQLAYESEREIHKMPSGIDQTISTFGGVICYRREKPFRRILLGRTFPIIIGNTGKTRSTGIMVSKVREFLASHDALKRRVMKLAEGISSKALSALQRGDIMRLGGIMNLNHELLRQIGVSTRDIDRLVSAALEAGAFGAKLTGAGGGGCMIALSPPHCTVEVLHAIRDAGGTPYLVNIERKGVRSWLVR